MIEVNHQELHAINISPKIEQKIIWKALHPNFFKLGECSKTDQQQQQQQKIPI